MDEATKKFVARLTESAQKMETTIPFHGRNAIIAKKLGTVTPEGVRKWFAGEARPRSKTLDALAKILNVEPGWLWAGGEKPPSPKDTRVHLSKVPGIVHFATGMAMIEGATCLPPDVYDSRKDFVDFIMVKNGVQAAIRTSLGREVRTDTFEFVVPSAFEQVHNVGFVWHDPTKVHLLDLKGELIAAHKTPKGSDKAVVIVYKNGKYVSGRDEWPRIDSIGDVL